MIIRLLKRILRRPYSFRLPGTSKVLPACRVRPVREADFAACEAIYHLNEPGRFPASVSKIFSKALRQQEALFLVAEIDGEIRGFGGVRIAQRQDAQFAWLLYGMVHPNAHRQGFGTVLLLARMAALPEPPFHWPLVITTVGGSETFYQRFGFVYWGQSQEEDGDSYKQYWMRFDSWDWAEARQTLARSSVTLALGDAAVPMKKEEF